MVNYESVYKGATYLLDPTYHTIGYHVPVSELGASTSIQTANQLSEVNKLLNQGMMHTEPGAIQMDNLESIPKDTFKEINRLNKLVGAKSSMHAPVIDPAGMTEQGWTEDNREIVENQFAQALIRGHDLDPEGNTPVVIHASNTVGSEEIPDTHRFAKPEEKGKDQILGRMIAINQETGEKRPIIRSEMYSPGGEGPKIQTPQEGLDVTNHTLWSDSITDLSLYKKSADELLINTDADFSKYEQQMKVEGKDFTEDEQKQIIRAQQNQITKVNRLLSNVEVKVRSLYEQASKYPEDTIKGKDPNSGKYIEITSNKIKDMTKEQLNEINKIKTEFDKKAEENNWRSNDIEYVKEKSNYLDNTLSLLEKAPAPKQYVSIEEFAKNKASDTISGAMFKSYKEYGDKSAKVVIENPPYGMALSTAKDLKDLIGKSRDKFAQKLIKEGKSKSQANETAKKLIGATWDTSHISMIRKQGFGKERLIKEAKEIAPVVQHVHFNDNFGTTHTDLPPGMGDVPMGEILKEFEKAGFEGVKIFEGGGFAQHFQASPFPYQLEGVGASVYEGGPGWNQLGTSAGYYFGQGEINTNIHHTTFGSGFSNLPAELGGQQAQGGGGDRGRMAQGGVAT